MRVPRLVTFAAFVLALGGFSRSQTYALQGTASAHGIAADPVLLVDGGPSVRRRERVVTEEIMAIAVCELSPVIRLVHESRATRTKAKLEWELAHAATLEASTFSSRAAGSIVPTSIRSKARPV